MLAKGRVSLAFSVWQCVAGNAHANTRIHTNNHIYTQYTHHFEQLYEEYMARSDTRATLAQGSFMGVISVLMQLRKVTSAPLSV